VKGIYVPSRETCHHAKKPMSNEIYMKRIGVES